MEIERLMKETVEGWQEMEGKAKVVWVVDQACENGKVRKKWRGCIEGLAEWIGSKTLVVYYI